MFNNRKRSKQKGPPFRQIYVPHDQRLLNYRPIPITNEFQAQYYLTQLKDMGYVRTPIPQIVSVQIKNTSNHISFDLDSVTQGFSHTSIDSNRNYLTDIQNNQLDIPETMQNQILDQQGFKLYPIIVTSSIGFYNATDSNKAVNFRDMDGGMSSSHTVASHSFWDISTSYSYFTQAYVSASGSNMLLSLYKDNSTEGNIDLFYGSKNSFYIYAKTVTCLVYKQ